MTTSKPLKIPLGPEPTLLSRKQVDALYGTLSVVQKAFQRLGVDFIVTGGSLLGAIRQHSILFCDDDVDIAILDYDGTVYEQVVLPNLQQTLNDIVREENEKDPTTQKKNPESYKFQIKPWEGGDRIRPKRMNTVFVDLFVLRPYQTQQDLLQVIGQKKNGQAQSQEYIDSVLGKLTKSAYSQGESLPLYPCWQFATRKAIEMWAKEVYRESELFPLEQNLKMGPLTAIQGPAQPVRLLKRAFGDDCFHVYYQSVSHVGGTNNNTSSRSSKEEKKKESTSKQQDQSGILQPKKESNKKEFKPLVAAAGTWEQNPKVNLRNEHYLPMQPIPKALRRHTLHNRGRLMEYLKVQSELEGLPFVVDDEIHGGDDHVIDDDGNVTIPSPAHEMPTDDPTASTLPPDRTIYMDGVFDLFHIGHLNAIQQCARLGKRVILGVTGDEDAAGYKRPPIVPQEERVAIVQALKCVHKVICPCPLIVTQEFMQQFDIDLVVHGFANDADAEKQKEFFEIPMSMGKFQRIDYYQGLSTTERIQKIQNQVETPSNADLLSKPNSTHVESKNGDQPKKSQWFGYTLAQATNNASSIPFDPFPQPLRQVMEPHIAKARRNRRNALDAIRTATGAESYDQIMKDFQTNFAAEGEIVSLEIVQKLKFALLTSLGLDSDFDLSQMHQVPGLKDKVLYQLTQSYSSFQSIYDDIVRTVCVPVLADKKKKKKEGTEELHYYYQAFPCIRIIQPNEFSIGPHADVAYGHHPCSINFYIPLTTTTTKGSSSLLFLESRMGSEDWHPIVECAGADADADTIKYFAGAQCMHWTTENKTDRTRISLDFRLIVGTMYPVLKNDGGKLDVYRDTKGYYHQCQWKPPQWERIGDGSSLAPPDARTGFPWTVKDWAKFWKQHQPHE